jgi:putative DNA primase/helicase
VVLQKCYHSPRGRERLRRTWKETLPLAHPKAHAVRSYLESRALGEILKRSPTVLRAHARLTYWDGTREFGTYPAMVALFHGASGQPVTLRVTYLRSDGCAKASVPSPKKILGVPVHGATRGGAIHLYEPRDGKLGLCEGIESALRLPRCYRRIATAAKNQDPDLNSGILPKP